MTEKKVSDLVIYRLSLYLRELTKLSKLNIHTVSSAELGDRVNLNDAQVRKDLGYFGQFGTSGAGYNTHELKTQLEKILGKDKAWNVAIVGIGHLGTALLSYPGFKEHGLNIVAAFDADKNKINSVVNGIIINNMEQMSAVIQDKKIAIGIITVSGSHAQEVADQLIKAGVECVLNFAPVSLSVPDNIKVKNVDLSRELEILSYFLVKNG